MKQTLTKVFFGEEASFFINANNPKIVKVQKLDREQAAVKITIEIEN